MDDRHRRCDEAEHRGQLRTGHPAQYTGCVERLELPELGQEDHDREAVHETEHDRVGHHSDELAEALQKIGELEDTVATLKMTGDAVAENADDAGDVLAEVLDRASKRVEEITAHFNRA